MDILLSSVSRFAELALIDVYKAQAERPWAIDLLPFLCAEYM